MKTIACSILFFLSIFFVFAENIELENKTNELKYILSLDTRYTTTALKNSGFGIGVSYEHKLTNFLSMKYIFGQMVLFLNITVLTIDQQLFLYYYPLGNGLDKLYIGLGHGGNLFMYLNDGDMSNDAALSITPIFGWKWRILKYFMIEPFIGWNFNILIINNYEYFNKYLDNGFQFGINLKISFSK